MAFLNICKHKFSFTQTTIAAFCTYIVLAFVITIILYTAPGMEIDIPGNIAIAVGLFVFAYRKLKNYLLSAYYAVLASVTVMIGGSTANILVDIIFSTYAYEFRDDLALYFLNLIP